MPQGAKLKPVHPRSREFTLPHGRLIRKVTSVEGSRKLRRSYSELVADSGRAADLCYGALISSATFGKMASLDGKAKRGECGVLLSSLSKPTLYAW